jgi:hypothetical protein
MMRIERSSIMMSRGVSLWFGALLLLVPATAAPPATVVFPDETLDYNINWPSGLGLGEVHWKAHNSGAAQSPYWEFSAEIDAHVPGYALVDSYRSSAGPKYCLETLTRDLQHGSRKSSDTVVVDQKALTATRTTANGGGASTFTVPDCVKDALSYLFFLRHELVSGRVPPNQTVLLGGAYEVKLTYLGTSTVKSGDRSFEADRVGCAIQGPSSKVDAELFFARDTVRTPVMIKIPLAMGTFSVELSH